MLDSGSSLGHIHLSEFDIVSYLDFVRDGAIGFGPEFARSEIINKRESCSDCRKFCDEVEARFDSGFYGSNWEIISREPLILFQRSFWDKLKELFK